MNILVVAAHPDDEVLGCGRTMARHVQEGHTVDVLILGEGMTSRRDATDTAAQDALASLHRNAQEANRHLGVHDVTIHALPDNRFDTVPLLDIVQIIEAKIATFQPSIIFAQHGGDLNIDHRCTFRAVMTAARPLHGSSVRQVYAYAVPSSTEWAFQQFAPVFLPNTFMDISATIEAKIAAMQRYESEVRPFPHPRSPEALRAHAAYWGSTAGLQAAEAFQLIRDVQ